MTKGYREHWTRLGYEIDPSTGQSEMGSAEVTLPPGEEFLRLYHVMPAEYAVSNLALHRMKIAKFSDLNDPFELLAANFREAPIRKVVSDYKNLFDKQAGILCFSSNWINPLLWSHYGNKHAGICLGFDIYKPLLHRVKYQKERIKIPLSSDKADYIDPQVTTDLLTTKFIDWQYEREYRVIFHTLRMAEEGSIRFRKFGEGITLKEVILGQACSIDIDAVRALTQIHYPDAVVFKARLAHKFFSVVPNEDTVL